MKTPKIKIKCPDHSQKKINLIKLLKTVGILTSKNTHLIRERRFSMGFKEAKAKLSIKTLKKIDDNIHFSILSVQNFQYIKKRFKKYMETKFKQSFITIYLHHLLILLIFWLLIPIFIFTSPIFPFTPIFPAIPFQILLFLER